MIGDIYDGQSLEILIDIHEFIGDDIVFGVLQLRLEAKHYLRAALELVQDMKYFLAVADNKTDEDSYTSMGLWDWK